MKNYKTCVDLLILHSKLIFKKWKHQPITSLRPKATFYNHFVVVIVLGEIVLLIHHHPKTFSVFEPDYVKSEFSNYKYLWLKLGYCIICLFECMYVYMYACITYSPLKYFWSSYRKTYFMILWLRARNIDLLYLFFNMFLDFNNT